MESQICVERLSNFVRCVCQMSNFIHPFSSYFIFLLFTHLFFFPGMIVHSYGHIKYVHYDLDFYSDDANHTVNSFAKLLRDLENLPVCSSHALFDGCGMTPLYKTVLQGKKVCMSSLSELPKEPTFAKPLPPTLHVQLNNCAKDNKCQYIFYFWSLLVAKSIFKEVFVSFLMVRQYIMTLMRHSAVEV